MKVSTLSVVFVVASFCGEANAESAALFSAPGLSKTEESISLSPAESSRLGMIRKLRSTRNATVVSLNLATLDSGVVTLKLGGKTYSYVGKKVVNPDGKTFNWSGKADSTDKRAPVDTATISGEIDGHGLAGQITAGGKTYSLHSLGPKFQAVVEIEPQEFIEAPPRMPKDRANQTPISKAPGEVRALSFNSQIPTIRILTVFSYEAAQATSPAAAVAQQITQLNDSFFQSLVNLKVESAGYLVHSPTSNYSSGVLNAVLSADDDLSILIARDTSNADVVMLVINSMDSVGGIGTQFATAASAFAAVQLSALTNLSFLHEFGHLLGAQHQAFGGVSNNDSSSYPYLYGHGWWVRDAQPGLTTVCYHTIMSYASASGPVCPPQLPDNRVAYWSNPAVAYRMTWTGDTFANNAQVLNNLGLAVTRFRFTKLASSKIGAALSPIFVGLLD